MPEDYKIPFTGEMLKLCGGREQVERFVSNVGLERFVSEASGVLRDEKMAHTMYFMLHDMGVEDLDARSKRGDIVERLHKGLQCLTSEDYVTIFSDGELFGEISAMIHPQLRVGRYSEVEPPRSLLYHWDYRSGAGREYLELFFCDKRIANFKITRDDHGRIIPNQTGICLFFDPGYTNFVEIYDRVQSTEGITEQDREDLLKIRPNLVKVIGFIPGQTSWAFYSYIDNPKKAKEAEGELKRVFGGIKGFHEITSRVIGELLGIEFDSRHYNNEKDKSKE